MSKIRHQGKIQYSYTAKRVAGIQVLSVCDVNSCGVHSEYVTKNKNHGKFREFDREWLVDYQTCER